METNQYFSRLTEYLAEHEQLGKLKKRGWCRVWSGSARTAINEFVESNELTSWQVEVREVDIEPCLSHTFIRLIANGEMYLLDGTGVSNYSEYYGLESDAPPHLQNSHRDWLDRI